MKLLLTSMLLGLAAPVLAAEPSQQAPFVWFGSGEVLYPSADFSPAVISMAPMLAGNHNAWKCQHFTVLGAALWSWDCIPVASHPQMQAWAPLPPELVQAVSVQTPLAAAQRSGWNRHGGLVLVLLALLLPVLVARWRAGRGLR